MPSRFTVFSNGRLTVRHLTVRHRAARRLAARRLAARRLGALLIPTLLVAGCGSSSPAKSGRIVAVGAENEYANVISQIGGKYVSVTAIMSNPNTDPHTFEASPSVAETVSAAELVVQNGVGYDTFMNKIESASSNSSRKVIDVQTLLGLPDAHRTRTSGTTRRRCRRWPPRWSRISRRSRRLTPPTSRPTRDRFDASLKPWHNALAAFKREHPDTPVATTEPVGDYMLEAAGTDNLTPWNLQADIMNGVDPAPQDISLQNNLFKDHRVKVFLYNQQVTDTLTQSFLHQAASYHVPVVGVYETMPLGYSYQSWMLAEVNALKRAVTSGQSTTKL